MKKVKRDITEVVDNYLCHSCGSCFSSCGHDCISYEKTTVGYLFPKIDYDSCTNCGLCFDVCPGDHFSIKLKEKTKEIDPFIGNIETTYVDFSNDEEIYNNSQSGGVTTSLLKYLLDNNIVSAAVVTVMDNVSLNSEARIIKNSSELFNSQKSKYVPTNLDSLVPELLQIDGKIAVVGLSCHFHGLENLTKIRKKLDNKLIKIGLICDRVMLYSSINYLTSRITKKSISNFVFRDTSNTPYPGDITFYENNKLHILDKKNRKNMKDFFTPIRCLLCFDKMNVYSDIVLGDPHQIENKQKENGESLVIVRSLLGKEIINNALEKKYISLREVSSSQALKGQGIELKKRKFNSNIAAWKELGNKVPDYPNEVFEYSIEDTSDNINLAKDRIIFSLKLDKIKSKNQLINEAENYFQNRNKKKSLFSKIKKMLKGK